jgi:hypothetical protein
MHARLFVFIYWGIDFQYNIYTILYTIYYIILFKHELKAITIYKNVIIKI